MYNINRNFLKGGELVYKEQLESIDELKRRGYHPGWWSWRSLRGDDRGGWRGTMMAKTGVVGVVQYVAGRTQDTTRVMRCVDHSIPRR